MEDDDEIIPVERMHKDTARELLYQKLENKAARSIDSGIVSLADALDYMPLALVQAAAYIRERAPWCSVQQYLAVLRERDRKKTSLLNEADGRLRRDEAASNSVILTWHISFNHIRNSRKSSNASDDDFGIDIATLRDYSFITATDSQIFEMDSLVQLATHAWLEYQGQLDRWRDQFIHNLCAAMPNGTYQNWPKLRVLFPHAKAAFAQRPRDEQSLKDWSQLLERAAEYAQGRRAGEAEDMAEASMNVRQELFGEAHRYTLRSMEAMAIAKRGVGKYKEAEAVRRQVLAIKKRWLGREHPQTLTSMDHLASALRDLGQFVQAETLQR